MQRGDAYGLRECLARDYFLRQKIKQKEKPVRSLTARVYAVCRQRSSRGGERLADAEGLERGIVPALIAVKPEPLQPLDALDLPAAGMVFVPQVVSRELSLAVMALAVLLDSEACVFAQGQRFHCFLHGFIAPLCECVVLFLKQGDTVQ